MSTIHETEEEVEQDVVDITVNSIILYNDDVNTFDHVILSLVQVCQHTEVQAEQVAWIVHTKGKCDVKHGEFDTLHPICQKLRDKGLSAVIEA